MAETTKIQWADSTWNPWIGCTKVSAECKNCYAENTTRARVLRSQGHETWGKGAQRSRTSHATWQKPRIWNAEVGFQQVELYSGDILRGTRKEICDLNIPEQAIKRAGPARRSVFPSLCDLFDDEVDLEWLVAALQVILETPNLNWLILTKRPENVMPLFDTIRRLTWPVNRERIARWYGGEFPSHVAIGVSAGTQAMADLRIPQLLALPAAMRFVSVEPILEQVQLNALRLGASEADAGQKDATGIDWVIVGGESGPLARPCREEWIRDIVGQCSTAQREALRLGEPAAGSGIPCFVKQMGSAAWMADERKLVHPKGGEMAEWPQDLRVREFPEFLEHGPGIPVLKN